MVESGVTEGGKNTVSFLFREWTQQQSYLGRETAASREEKDADNIRKVFCESFIKWFWELNLCSYKYRVDCFDSLR